MVIMIIIVVLSNALFFVRLPSYFLIVHIHRRLILPIVVTVIDDDNK